MASSVRLAPDEAWAVIESAHTGVLTTLRRDGTPIALPIWFVSFGKKIYVSGPTHTKKFARIRNDDRVSFLVESGERWAELVGVHLTGTAHLVTDPELREEVMAASTAKYSAFRTSRKKMPDATRSHYEVELAIIEINPDDRILSWENSRLFPEGE